MERGKACGPTVQNAPICIMALFVCDIAKRVLPNKSKERGQVAACRALFRRLL